eukprot:GILJ01010449.1.p1 GENE.GILJ01010449.1~~GILJ01010449.1.p1  ORF type:complete len:165 (+),score=10.44 GILJ01010449.1:51-497(+)
MAVLESKRAELERMKGQLTILQDAANRFETASDHSIAHWTNKMCLEVIDEECWDLCLELHRELKTGRVIPPADLSVIHSVLPSVQAPVDDSVDIHGNTPARVPTDSFPCLRCGRPVNASRYAPHLETCMGKGGRRSRKRDAFADTYMT